MSPHPCSRKPSLALSLGVLLSGVVTASTASAQDPLEGTDSSGDVTETIPSSSGDVTETVGGGSETTADPPPEPIEPAPSAAPKTRIQASGYLRQSLELVYGELARQSLTNAAPVLWRDVFLSRSQLVLRASYIEERHFEATVSGILSYTAHVAKRAPYYSFGVVDLVRGEVEPELREAYVGFFWPAVDLRIGQQRVAWGRSDFQSPNDVINARDLRDPFLTEPELRYLPTPVVRASVTGGAVTFEAIASPFFVPDRVDVYGSNWSALQLNSPAGDQAFVTSTGAFVDASVESDVARFWRQTERPKDNGKGASVGAKLSANLPGTDLDAYYHYGYDSLPYVQIDPRFVDYLNTTDFKQPGGAKFAPVFNSIDGESRPLRARYLRRHHAGFDVATVLGSFVLRLDAAYESRRVFYRKDLNSFATPALLGVAGIEYQTGSMDDILLIEVLAAHLINKQKPDAAVADQPPISTPLLGYEQTTSAVAGTLRWTLGEGWGVDLRGLVGISPKSFALQPALRYMPSDAFTLRLGALVVSGEQDSFGWYYGDNDTAFVQLRYAF